MSYLPLLTVTWHVLPGIPADEEEEDDDMRDDAADPKLAEGGSLLPQVCVTYRYIPSLTVSSPREAHCRLTRCVSLLTVTCGYVLFLAADASGDECRCAFAVGLLHSSLTVTYRYLARATRQVCFRRGLHRSTCRRCRFWPRCVHPLLVVTYRYWHVLPLHLSLPSCEAPSPTPYTLHPTPYTPHPTPYTPHPVTPHPTPHDLHPALRTERYCHPRGCA